MRFYTEQEMHFRKNIRGYAAAMNEHNVENDAYAEANNHNWRNCR